jgi:hypothetical protein
VGQILNLRPSWGALWARPARRLQIAAQDAILPHMAASRNEWWRFSEVAAGASKGGQAD